MGRREAYQQEIRLELQALLDSHGVNAPDDAVDSLTKTVFLAHLHGIQAKGREQAGLTPNIDEALRIARALTGNVSQGSPSLPSEGELRGQLADLLRAKGIPALLLHSDIRYDAYKVADRLEADQIGRRDLLVLVGKLTRLRNQTASVKSGQPWQIHMPILGAAVIAWDRCSSTQSPLAFVKDFIKLAGRGKSAALAKLELENQSLSHAIWRVRKKKTK